MVSRHSVQSFPANWALVPRQFAKCEVCTGRAPHQYKTVRPCAWRQSLTPHTALLSPEKVITAHNLDIKYRHSSPFWSDLIRAIALEFQMFCLAMSIC